MKDTLPATHPKNILKTFANENSDKYSKIESAGRVAGDLEEICSDDEIWFVQSAKGINFKDDLMDHKIKLPGKSTRNSIETVSEEFSRGKSFTLAYRSTKSYNVKQLQVCGSILIRECMKPTATDNETNTDYISNKSFRQVPFPSNLKQRHPLHGADYEKKILLNDKVQKKLKMHKRNVYKRSKAMEVDDKIYAKKSKNRIHKSNKFEQAQNDIKIIADDDEEELAWVKST